MILTQQQYTQERHCCQEQETADPTLTLQLLDGGGGWYVVVTAVEWACSEADEIDRMAGAAKRLLLAAQTAEKETTG